ncbi:hypothetical protein BT69DRAFT_1351303 [Atractiella rhizophila]|nr:hypothetical protein BT69DRAFT_1351303 [Atractiella rhizophila]
MLSMTTSRVHILPDTPPAEVIDLDEDELVLERLQRQLHGLKRKHREISPPTAEDVGRKQRSRATEMGAGLRNEDGLATRRMKVETEEYILISSDSSSESEQEEDNALSQSASNSIVKPLSSASTVGNSSRNRSKKVQKSYHRPRSPSTFKPAKPTKSSKSIKSSKSSKSSKSRLKSHHIPMDSTFQFQEDEVKVSLYIKREALEILPNQGSQSRKRR